MRYSPLSGEPDLATLNTQLKQLELQLSNAQRQSAMPGAAQAITQITSQITAIKKQIATLAAKPTVTIPKPVTDVVPVKTLSPVPATVTISPPNSATLTVPIPQSEVKTYFDVSTYRNILDLIKQYNSSLKAVANWARNKLNPIVKVTRYGGAIYGYMQTHKIASAKDYTNKLLARYDRPALKENDHRLPQTSPYDLLSLARSIQMEMNRVRLPMPHNFRQLSALIEGRIYDDIWVGATDSKGNLPGRSIGKFIGLRSDHGVISLWKLLEALPQLDKAADIMLDEVRKEIDAANLAKQVQEETIRRDREELITREQAEKDAISRALAIQKEKEALYTRDAIIIAERKQKLIDDRAIVTAELNTLNGALQYAQDPQAIADMQNRMMKLTTTLDVIALEERNIDVLTETLINAVQNLATDNTDLRRQIAELSIQRNREKSQAIRDLEKRLAEYAALAAQKLDELNKRRQAELDKLIVLENQNAPNNEIKAVENNINTIEQTMNTVINTVTVDTKAAENAQAQKQALETDSQLKSDIVTIQETIDSLVKQGNPDAAKIAELQAQLNQLTTQKTFNDQNIDILKSQAQTLEQQVTPKKPVNLLPLFGLLTLVLSQ